MVLTKMLKAVVFTIVWCILVFTFAMSSHAKGRNYESKIEPKYGDKKQYTLEQKKRKGLKENPKYIKCRLAKIVKTKSGVSACIYRGGNKTYELVVENKCPRNLLCKYNPWQKEPNIDDIVDSLNNAMKKKK
tara:strand:- start:199 stop:594 length:396 start_codon:yes stop_codon:yes gene_type:complete